MSARSSILVVRRDNIGDLVCTTPLFAALRRRYPRAWIGALVNSYNAPVLERNPDLDQTIVYRKLKHLEPGEGKLAALRERIGMLRDLRRRRLDCVVLAAPGFVPRSLLLARALGARAIAGFSDGSRAARAIDLPVMLETTDRRHEVERVFALAPLLGIDGAIPPLRLEPDPAEVAKVRQTLDAEGHLARRPLIGVHISARRPAQRWPADRYAELIQILHATHGGTALLLWSPGEAGHAQHPGDDAKAATVELGIDGRAPLAACRTESLRRLIAALSLCDALMCSDGGAMHLAAALGKPIVCLFGDSPAERWYPWGVPHRVLQGAKGHVESISARDAAQALTHVIESRPSQAP